MKKNHFLLPACILLLFLATVPVNAQNRVEESWPNGNPSYEGEWNDQLRIGKHKWWHENGEKKAEVNFSESGKPLVCYTWNEKGEIMDEITFEYEENISSEINLNSWDTLPSGLLFHLLPAELPPGPSITKSARAGVKYKGCLADGSVFEDISNRSKPFRFRLGAGEVISGFEEAVSQLKLNQTCIVKIPPGLGYGENLVGNIPPGSELIYIISLVEIE